MKLIITANPVCVLLNNETKAFKRYYNQTDDIIIFKQPASSRSTIVH